MSAARPLSKPLPDDIDVSVIIVNYNTASLLPKAIDALRASSSGLKVQVIVIDNASRDDSVARIRREYAELSLIANDRNVGFGRANNQALPLAVGRYVLLLNTDALVATDTLKKTLAYMDAHPRCGILGVRLTSPDGALQPSARYFPTPWNRFLTRSGLDRLRIFKLVRLVDDMEWDHAAVRQCDWVPGCYYLVRRELIHDVGLFDPRYFLYYEEVDHCFAAKRAGWEVVFYPDTTVIHIGGASAKSEGELTAAGRQLERLQIESELLYFRKNIGLGAVWLDVILNVAADILILLKRLLKRRSPVGARVHLRHSAIVWKLLWQTRFGTRCTR